MKKKVTTGARAFESGARSKATRMSVKAGSMMSIASAVVDISAEIITVNAALLSLDSMTSRAAFRRTSDGQPAEASPGRAASKRWSGAVAF